MAANRSPGLLVGVLLALALLGLLLAVAAPRAIPVALVALLLLGNLALVAGAVLSALLRPDLTSAQRLVWVLIAVFAVPVVAVGAIAYFVLGRSRTRELFADLQLGRPSAPPPPPSAPPRT